VDKRNNQIRGKSIMRRLGVIVDKDDELDNLLMYFLWPGPSAIRMPAGEVCTVREEHRVRRDRELRGRVTGAKQIRIVQEMEIKKKIAQEHMEKNKWRMHQSPEHWWKHTQHKESMQRLHDRLGMLIQEAEHELLDETNFITLHDRIWWD
jgi:hypothetical protein